MTAEATRASLLGPAGPLVVLGVGETASLGLLGAAVASETGSQFQRRQQQVDLMRL